MEDEQTPRTYNVYVILCVRRHFAVVRVRLVHMSTLKRISKIEINSLDTAQQRFRAGKKKKFGIKEKKTRKRTLK